jgi:hypothetical protein
MQSHAVQSMTQLYLVCQLDKEVRERIEFWTDEEKLPVYAANTIKSKGSPRRDRVIGRS